MGGGNEDDMILNWKLSLESDYYEQFSEMADRTKLVFLAETYTLQWAVYFRKPGRELYVKLYYFLIQRYAIREKHSAFIEYSDMEIGIDKIILNIHYKM